MLEGLFSSLVGITFIVFTILIIFPIKRVKALSSRGLNFVWMIVGISVFTAAYQLSLSPEERAKAAAENEAREAERQKEKLELSERQKAGEDYDYVRDNFREFVELERFQSNRGGFGSVAVISGRLRNKSNFEVYDVTLRCHGTTPSGTTVSSDSVTVFVTVPPKGVARFSDLVVGRIDQQVTNFGCEVRRGGVRL